MTQARDAKKRPDELRQHESFAELKTAGPQHPFLQLQRLAGNQAVLGLMTSPGPVVQRKCATCTATSKCSSCEEEERLQRKEKNASLFSSTSTHIQRAPNNSVAEPTAVGTLIVDDDAASIQPGQMRKSEFLEQLRSNVCSTADEAMKEAGQSTAGCPYLEQWFSYYAEQTPAHVERALQKYAPEAATATSARDYIPAVSNRVRQAVQRWAQTGELTGVPDELAGMLSGGGGMAGILGAIGGAIGGALSAIGGAIGSAVSSIGNALFKRKEGPAAPSDEPQAIQAQLSGGQPLNATVGSRMGEAFGHDFSHVRVHTDASAAGLSEQLNARAFTIGSDVAFGAGEYQPGTLIGDALIAHELAHVIQQQSGEVTSSAAQSKNDADYNRFEEEADVAAVGAVASLWGDARSAISDIGRNAMPRLKSGLRLQSCPSKPPQIQVPRGGWVTPEQADQLLSDDKVIGPRIKSRVAKGVKAVGHTSVLNTESYLSKATELGGEGSKIEKVSIDMMRAGGFAHEGEIYLHQKTADYMDVRRNGQVIPVAVPPSAHPATIVHEAIHLYGSDTWAARTGHSANEGTTEYFTRRVLSKQKNEEGGGAAVFERDSYPDEYAAVKCLASEANDELLADAYFLGQVDPLRKKVGEKAFDKWVAEMKSGEFAKAHVALGCKPPAKAAEE